MPASVDRDATRERPLPIRIYALAKELKLDSKVLVDICTKAGVTGKGSALASLTDEEMSEVKAFIAGGKAGGDGARAPVGQLRRTGCCGRRGGLLPADPLPPFRREDYIASRRRGRRARPPVLERQEPRKAKREPTAETTSRRNGDREREERERRRSSWRRCPRPRSRRTG